MVIYLNNKYYIGGLYISINSYDDEYFEKVLSSYQSDFSGDADITITVTKSKNEINPQYTNLTRIGDGKYYCVSDGCDAMIHHDSNIGKVIAFTVFNRDYSKVDITAYDVKENCGISDLVFVHNLVGNAMRYVVMMHSGIVFHSSSVCCKDGGVAFSAESGTGKSTHTGLWLSQFDDAAILNDDTPIIRLKSDGEVFIYGTPLAGTTGINLNREVPLKGVVFLSRAKENQIERIETSKALKLFYEGINAPLNATMNLCVLDTLNSIMKSVPIYALGCNMDPEAAIVARKYIFNN